MWLCELSPLSCKEAGGKCNVCKVGPGLSTVFFWHSTSGLLKSGVWTLNFNFSFVYQKSLMHLLGFLTAVFSITSTFEEEVVALLKRSRVCQSQLLDGKPGLELLEMFEKAPFSPEK